jgi:1-deoxy-D-xylulose-5-phosphate synthase
VRYPRCAAGAFDPEAAPRTLPIGISRQRRAGKRVALLSFGSMLDTAMAVGEELGATVVDMRFVKPLDTAAVLQLAGSHELLVTLEENAIAGGAGSAVAECLAARGATAELLMLGLPDRPLEHGTRDEVLRDAGLDRAGVLSAITNRWNARQPEPAAQARRPNLQLVGRSAAGE